MFAVSFTDEPKVEIIDISGKTIHSTKEPMKNIYFQRPLFVRFGVSGREIYVTDQISMEIICIQICKESNRLREKFRTRVRELDMPRDICVIEAIALLICGYNSCNVCKLSPSSENLKVILSKKDGIENPCAMTFLPEKGGSLSGTLFVSCNRLEAPPAPPSLSDNIKVFNLGP